MSKKTSLHFFECLSLHRNSSIRRGNWSLSESQCNFTCRFTLLQYMPLWHSCMCLLWDLWSFPSDSPSDDDNPCSPAACKRAICHRISCCQASQTCGRREWALRLCVVDQLDVSQFCVGVVRAKNPLLLDDSSDVVPVLPLGNKTFVDLDNKSWTSDLVIGFNQLLAAHFVQLLVPLWTHTRHTLICTALFTDNSAAQQ